MVPNAETLPFFRPRVKSFLILSRNNVRGNGKLFFRAGRKNGETLAGLEAGANLF